MGATAKIQSNSVFQRVKDIPFSQLDDELLAIDAQAGYVYSLSESAGRVWDLIATPISLDVIVSQLQKEFNVDEQTCVRDVSQLLQDLRDAGLVQAIDVVAG